MFKRNPNCIIHLSTDTGAPPIPVFDKKFIIGRKATHVVAIPDNSISRDHIEIQVTDSEILVKDLGTANGTKIDGQTIASQVPIPYSEGQIITLGHSTIGIVIELMSKNKKNVKPSTFVIQPPPPEFNHQPPEMNSPSFMQSNVAPIHQSPQQNIQPISQPQVVVAQNPTPEVYVVPSMNSSSAAAPQLYTHNEPAPSPQVFTVTPPLENAQPQVVKQTFEEPKIHVVTSNDNFVPTPISTVSPTNNDASINQAKDEANRILARAKIDAEMQVRDLLRSKESEAQAIINQAQKTSLEKIKEAENLSSEKVKNAETQAQEMIKVAQDQVHLIINKAEEEGKKIKEEILGQVKKEQEIFQAEGERLKNQIINENNRLKDEGLKEKEKILQEAEIERQQITDRAISQREAALKELDELNLKIPHLKEQIQTLQTESLKFTEERNSCEIKYQEVYQKLQLADSQVNSQEDLLKRLKDDFATTQKNLLEAEEQKRKAIQDSHKMMMEAQEALSSSTKKEQEAIYTLEQAKKQKEDSDKYSSVTRQETDAEVQRKLDYLKQELDRRTASVNLDLETRTKKVNQEIEDKTAKLNQEIQSRTTKLNQEIEDKTKSLNNEIETRRKSLDQEIETKTKQFNLESERRLKLFEQEAEKKVNALNLETQKILTERERVFNEMKRKQDSVLTELKQSEDSKMKALLELDGVMKNKRDALEKEINERIMGLNGEYERKRSGLQSEFNTLRANYEKELNEHKDLKDKEFNELKLKREQEFKEMKLQQDAYLKEMKQNEEEKVRLMLEESQKYLKSQREIRVKNVNEAVEKYFSDLMLNANAEFASQAPFIRDNIKLIIQENINNEFAGEENKLRQILDYNPEIANKHKQFWKKAAIWGGVTIAVLGYILYKPSTIKEIPKQMEASVHEIEEKNKKVIQDQQEAIRLAQIYKPEQTDQYQESYTDNVIYLKRYLEFEYNDKSYKEWVVIANNFLQNEVGMKDDEAMQFISNESSLIHNLETKKALIDGTKPEVGIKAMRQVEDEYQPLMESGLKGKKETYWNLKKSHYEKYLKENPGQ